MTRKIAIALAFLLCVSISFASSSDSRQSQQKKVLTWDKKRYDEFVAQNNAILLLTEKLYDNNGEVHNGFVYKNELGMLFLEDGDCYVHLNTAKAGIFEEADISAIPLFIACIKDTIKSNGMKATLQKITGQDFGFDVEKLTDWYEKNKKEEMAQKQIQSNKDTKSKKKERRRKE